MGKEKVKEKEKDTEKDTERDTERDMEMDKDKTAKPVNYLLGRKELRMSGQDK